MIKNHLILDLKSEILDLKMKDSDLLADNHRVKTVIFIRNNLQFWSKFLNFGSKFCLLRIFGDFNLHLRAVDHVRNAIKIEFIKSM